MFINRRNASILAVISIPILATFLLFATSPKPVPGATDRTVPPTSRAPTIVCGGLCMTLIGVALGAAVAYAYDQATDDDGPEIANVEVIVPESNSIYVGQKRTVTVLATVSFGHIRGYEDIGVIRLNADIDGEQVHTEEKRYTVETDYRQTTETLGRWEGVIPFEFDLEAKEYGTSAHLNVDITVTGDENGLFSDDRKTVGPVSETVLLDILFPFDKTSNDKTGFLNPATETITHYECFDQDLLIKSYSTAPGEVKIASLGKETWENVDFVGKESYEGNNPIADTLIYDVEIGHDAAEHMSQSSFYSEWSLYGSDNIRLFLDGEGEWTFDGDSGPGPDVNYCDGVIAVPDTCNLVPAVYAPQPRDINDSYLLVIHSHSQEPRPGSNHDVVVTDNNGFFQQITTDGNGNFTINQNPLGPLVSITLVDELDTLFVPKTITSFNVALLDQSEDVHFDTFHIMERTAPVISGTVSDDAGSPLNAELFVHNGTVETSIGIVHGSFSIGGIDQGVMGYPTTIVRVEVLPNAYRCYTTSSMLDTVPSTAGPIALGNVEFVRCPPAGGYVTFTGTFMSGNESLVPLPNLAIAVSGAGEAVTDANGHFEMMVPPPSQKRFVTFPNIETFARSSCYSLEQPPGGGDSILFGQSGDTLDLGVVVLDEVQTPMDGPWRVQEIDLFQDTWPTDGTTVGTGRIDTGRDILADGNPIIQPGDSCVFSFTDPAPDPSGFGPAVYLFLSVDPPGQPGKSAPAEIEEDHERWPVVDSLLCQGRMWYKFRCDTVFIECDGPRTCPQTGRWCIDVNDQCFTNGDKLYFFFGAEDISNELTYWSQFTGAVTTREEACSDPMEMQILPSNLNRASGGDGDILYVNNSGGQESRAYFDTAFELMGILDEVDRFDMRGPSTLAGNDIAGRVTNQLIPCYRKIIWSSGELRGGTVGDGISTGKADDFAALFAFVDQDTSTAGCGVYFSGDHLAEEWNTLTGAAVSFKSTYMPYTLVSGDLSPLHGASPFVSGSDGGIFDHGLPGMLDDEDTLIVYDGCPVSNDFDQIAPGPGATLEMTYSGTGLPSDGAVIAHSTVNSNSKPVRVVLSGFSYHYIRDAEPTYPNARTEHLADIIRWLGDDVEINPTAVPRGAPLRNFLDLAYPNPFNPTTTIKYGVKEVTNVSLKVYNVAGQLVKTLVSDVKTPGAYEITWRGESNAGNQVASGVYFYRLVAKDFTKTRKLVILK